MKKLILSILTATSVGLGVAQSAVIQFDLIGTAGAGLLPGNEPGVLSGGSGGELGSGITYDTVTNVLDLTNVGWGSSQGFSDLSSAASASHIHVTTNPNGNNGTADFTQTGGTVYTLTRSSNAVTGGIFSNPLFDLDTVADPELKEADLLAGKWYINIHTANNGGGEMRGFLVVVPEPGTSLLGLLALSVFSLRRRR